MKIFSGFPPGRVEVTPVPNLFFSELCPAIEDLAELKLTLHLLWLFSHKKNRTLHVTASELSADQTLMESLTGAGPDAAKALERALALATERGTLLRLDVSDARTALYFINSEIGRREFERFERASPPSEAIREEPASGIGRKNIFVLYEQNIGLLTPLISEELKQAEQEYSMEWIEDAFRIALRRNVRRWDYINAILKRWKTEGRTEDRKKRDHWWNDEYDQFINR